MLSGPPSQAPRSRLRLPQERGAAPTCPPSQNRLGDFKLRHYLISGSPQFDIGRVRVVIAYAMYQRAAEAGAGTRLAIQDNMIFQHEELANWIRM